jgi:hypothetical protein
MQMAPALRAWLPCTPGSRPPWPQLTDQNALACSREYPSDPACYELLEDCGRGVSATVHRALCLTTDEIVAVKKMNLERVNMTLVGGTAAGSHSSSGQRRGTHPPTQQQQQRPPTSQAMLRAAAASPASSIHN